MAFNEPQRIGPRKSDPRHEARVPDPLQLARHLPPISARRDEGLGAAMTEQQTERPRDGWSDIFSGIPAVESDAFARLLVFCEAHEARVLATLPSLAAEIAGRDGFAAMFQALKHRGGLRVFVGRDHTTFMSRCGIRVGAPTFDRMRSEANAAGCIEIPSAWGAFIALRRVAIILALEAGGNPRDVASSFGVTERSLRNLRTRDHDLRNASA